MNLIEQVQYKAALLVSGCWQGTNSEKLYDELGCESLSERRWSRRMTMFRGGGGGDKSLFLRKCVSSLLRSCLWVRY